MVNGIVYSLFKYREIRGYYRFKHYAEAQNLTAKINARNMLREIVNQDMTDYGLKNVDWASWSAGVFT
jgi:hypothetical protein